MTGVVERYFAALTAKLSRAAESQAGVLARAAEACADALAAGGVIHLFDTGHMVSHELVYRTGGLPGFTPLRFGGTLDNHNLRRGPPVGTDEAAERALLDWVFAGQTLRPGDVLVISSVSGTSMRVVELAHQARARGLTVVALTAPAYAARLEPRHSSGLRLHEVADLVLDDQADYGDAMLEVDGLDQRICPISGVAGAVLMWALTAGIVERLLARGITPSVFPSVNLPDGPEQVRRVEDRYRAEGI